MKKILLITALFYGSLVHAKVEGTYGLHLFFNEKEYIDVLTLSRLGFGGPNGTLTGKMDVPNDFTGNLLNIKVDGRRIEFDLVVPKNPSRPREMLFHYVGQFYDDNHNQMIGYVVSQQRVLGKAPQMQFIASFVAFRRSL